MSARQQLRQLQVSPAVQSLPGVPHGKVRTLPENTANTFHTVPACCDSTKDKTTATMLENSHLFNQSWIFSFLLGVFPVSWWPRSLWRNWDSGTCWILLRARRTQTLNPADVTAADSDARWQCFSDLTLKTAVSVKLRMTTRGCCSYDGLSLSFHQILV